MSSLPNGRPPPPHKCPVLVIDQVENRFPDLFVVIYGGRKVFGGVGRGVKLELSVHLGSFTQYTYRTGGTHTPQ